MCILRDTISTKQKSSMNSEVSGHGCFWENQETFSNTYILFSILLDVIGLLIQKKQWKGTSCSLPFFRDRAFSLILLTEKMNHIEVSTHKGFWEYPKVRDGAFKEVCLWLEISIKDCDKLIVFHIFAAHCRLEVAGLISCAICSMPIYDVNPLLVPFGHLSLD